MATDEIEKFAPLLYARLKAAEALDDYATHRASCYATMGSCDCGYDEASNAQWAARAEHVDNYEARNVAEELTALRRVARLCPQCEGSGRYAAAPCEPCDGAGAIAGPVCGFCGQAGADKIPHPVHWPGENSAGTDYVHADCEEEETIRAHSNLTDEQRRRFLTGMMK